MIGHRARPWRGAAAAIAVVLLVCSFGVSGASATADPSSTVTENGPGTGATSDAASHQPRAIGSQAGVRVDDRAVTANTVLPPVATGYAVPVSHAELRASRPAGLVVRLAETKATVLPGDRLEVAATVENVADRTGTRETLLDVADRTGVDSRVMDLDGGEATTGTLGYEPAPDGAGALAVTSRSTDDEAMTSVDVPGPDEAPSETEQRGADDSAANGHDYGIEIRDFNGDGIDDVRLSNGRVWVRVNSADLDSGTYVSAIGRSGTERAIGPWRIEPERRNGSGMTFRSLEAFAVVANDSDRLAYRVVRRYEVDDVSFRVATTVTLPAGSDAAIVETEWTNLGSREVRLGRGSSETTGGLVLTRGIGFDDPIGDYRFHVSGSGTHAFDVVGSDRTFRAEGDPAFVTVFDDETGVVYALLDGPPGRGHVVMDGRPTAAIDFSAQGAAVGPNESVEFVTAIGAHEGGGGAVTRAKRLVTAAERDLATVRGADEQSAAEAAVTVGSPARVESGDDIAGQLTVGDRVHVYSVEAAAGQVIRLVGYVFGDGHEETITVFSPSFDEVVNTSVRGEASDPVPYGGIAPETGTYLLILGDGRIEANGARYEFDVSIVNPDPAGDNDDRDTADPLTPGQPVQEHRAEGDEDWFAVSAEAGDLITTTMSIADDVRSWAGLNDVGLEIVDENGHRIGDDRAGADEARTNVVIGDYEAKQTAIAPADGIYYVRLPAFDLEGYTAYDLTVDVSDGEPSED